MPVLILAGIEDIDIVRPLAARLLEGGGEVRCYLDDDDYELRNMGCKLAVGSLVDEMNLEGALTNVHTFIPLFPDPVRLTTQSDLDALERLGSTVASAAGSARISQTILAIPAIADAANPLRAPFAEVERCVAEAVDHVCMLRTGFVWGGNRPFTECMRALRGRQEGSLPGGGRSLIGVVRAEDLADLICAADDREQLQGVWEFGGTGYRLSKLPTFAGEGRERAPSAWLEELLALDCLAGSSAATEFGVMCHPLH